MILNIATTNSSMSLQRHTGLFQMLKSHAVPYRMYTTEVTPLKFDSLYNTAKKIIQDHIEDPYVIFAEDDLVLTEAFSIEKMETCIGQAVALNIDVLATGAFLSYEEVAVTDSMLKIGGFRGTQLIVIFKSAYQILLDSPTYNHFEDTISKCQPKLQIGLTFPFLSKQREDVPSMIVAKNHNYLFHENEEQIKRRLNL
ncbi:hypothetical protein HDF26_005209 [Pedobacter cryoconitis]|uniref:hypothetical protein n=1 Tax=Pedobacter cryoconitis TaxID=188932 RepID=UPI001617C1CC|nr:hypothetical protein [Pedobacter cryoconitis]MBB6274727.1 hypothetical protein [Pedobacter cryoconitis]